MRHTSLAAPRIWQTYLLCWLCGTLAAAWPAASIIAFGGLILLDRRLWTWSRLTVALFLTICAFGTAHHHFSFARNLDAHTPQWMDEDGTRRVCGQIADVRGLADYRCRLLLKDVSPQDLHDPLPGVCSLLWENPPAWPLPGQSICFNGHIKKVRMALNDSAEGIPPHQIAQESYWSAAIQGEGANPLIFGIADKGAAIRRALRQKFIDALPSPMNEGSAILLALVFGDKYYLSSGLNDKFASAGLAHSLALSGQHLVVAGLFGLLSILLIMRRCKGFYLICSRMSLVALASLPFALFYLWLGDAPASLLRAFCMLVVLAFYLAAKIPYTGFDVLATALLLILLFNPLAIFDTGLQLSILCLVCLTGAAPLLKAMRKQMPPIKGGKILLAVGQIALVSLLIQIFILPVSLNLFQRAGLFFLPNLLWLPIMAFIVLPFAGLALCLLALHLPGAQTLLYMASLPCNIIVGILERCQEWGLFYEPAWLTPEWPLVICFIALFLAICHMGLRQNRPRIHIGLFIFMGCLLVISPISRLWESLSGTVRLDILDVGQGQAVLVGNYANKILIDGGGSVHNRFDVGRRILTPALTVNSPPILQAVANTHPDMDHLGGLFHVLQTFRVDQYFHNGDRPAREYIDSWGRIISSKKARILKTDDLLVSGDAVSGLRIEVLNPPEARIFNGNDASLILRIWLDGQSIALICGDAGVAALENVLATASDLRSTVLVVPHHGSNKNFHERFYQAVAPKVAIISCGYKNRWNFPGGDVVNWFRTHGIPVLTTAECGKISFSFHKEKPGEFTIHITIPAAAGSGPFMTR